jgi:ACS family hexuronate transporter-like MFS transporter
MPTHRPAWFRWYICGLLLLATTINYMDRQTLSNMKTKIQAALDFLDEPYGDLELGFGLAFAAGALFFGFLADYVSVRWLYAIVLVAWSLVGVATGYVRDYDDLLICRVLLGFFEAGHWPCALRTTQAILTSKDRTLGNSILQSGSSIGAIITPLIINLMLTDASDSWRFPFCVIGYIGLGWVLLWLAAVRSRDIAAGEAKAGANERLPETAALPAAPSSNPYAAPSLVADETRASHRVEAAEPHLPRSAWIRRLFVLVVVVATINMCWHLFRAWLPSFLEKGRGYTDTDARYLNSAFNVATDVGCLVAGAATLFLQRRISVGWSRWLVYTGCSLLTLFSIGVALTPKGPWLIVQLMFLGAGALGLFPCYYSLSQEISRKHQGKITGILGVVAWVTASPVHKYFGRYVDQTSSYDLGVAIAGCLPLVGAVAWLLVWDWKRSERHP